MDRELRLQADNLRGCSNPVGQSSSQILSLKWLTGIAPSRLWQDDKYWDSIDRSDDFLESVYFV